jgi:hypothetical protein
MAAAITVQVLRNDLNRLNKKRKDLTRPIQEHPREYVLLPIRALAGKLGTDPATILNIVRGKSFSTLNYGKTQRGISGGTLILHLYTTSTAFKNFSSVRLRSRQTAEFDSACLIWVELHSRSQDPLDHVVIGLRGGAVDSRTSFCITEMPHMMKCDNFLIVVVFPSECA